MKTTKKFRTLSLIFAVVFGLIWSRSEALAAGSFSPDSSGGGYSIGSAVDFGNPNYADSEWIDCDGDSTSCASSPLISTTSSYTILSYAYMDSDIAIQISCGSVDLPGNGLGSWLQNTSNTGVWVFHSDVQIHCTGDLNTNTAEGYYVVQYVPYDTRTVVQSTTTMPLTDTHFGIIAGYFLAFWTMIFIVWLFKGQKRI